MHIKRKRTADPLPEVYTRVTNPERFRRLHDFALERLAQLRNDYDAIESNTFEMVPGVMRRVEYARPPVTLTPVITSAASISVAFTSFPSLIVRCGRFFNAPFPVCACDGCDASADDEAKRFQEIVANVVSGHFREDVELPFFGSAQVRWRLGSIHSPYGLSEGGMSIPRASARSLRSEGLTRVEWIAWPRR